jgi:hypothetical protein
VDVSDSKSRAPPAGMRVQASPPATPDTSIPSGTSTCAINGNQAVAGRALDRRTFLLFKISVHDRAMKYFAGHF